MYRVTYISCNPNQTQMKNLFMSSYGGNRGCQEPLSDRHPSYMLLGVAIRSALKMEGAVSKKMEHKKKKKV